MKQYTVDYFIQKFEAIHIETGELHLFDQKKYGFLEHTLDLSKLEAAGYEVLGEL
jgi:hypothetical protein